MIAHGRDWIAQRAGEEAGSQIIISLLIPFTAYLAAEQLQCSGILAAVTAGVTLSYVESSGQALPGTRMRRSSVWDMLRFAANGIVFVLLGEQLPAILSGAAETVRMTGHQQAGWLLAYVIAINIGVIALRFVWVWASLSLTMFKSRLSGAGIRRPNWRLVTATSLAGVRGAITLAGVLTIPVMLNDGAAFPARDLAITLAMGVIIVSLMAASAGLPWLLKGVEMPDEPEHNAEENRARVAAAEAAIAEIERIQHEHSTNQQDAEEYLLAATMITDLYRMRVEARSHQGQAATHARHSEAIERRLRVAGIRAERVVIFELLRAQQIGSESATKIVRELDLLETRHET
jgi:CPA1 family monovalent cation:H+ antiporter